jgi:hypothetical protein
MGLGRVLAATEQLRQGLQRRPIQAQAAVAQDKIQAKGVLVEGLADRFLRL